LEKISKKFGTKLINLSDGRNDSGCDTCDHGSSYGATIIIEKPTKNIV
jgi:hypothetical protein